MWALLITIDLEDGSRDGLIALARLIQPSLRCVLIAGYHYFRREDSLK
jgi:hypothetical protein